ncbi:SEC14 domain and spectrin repeat-containing protein 1 [Poecilia reticulata]|uniref:SEC14 domain and spectrin repeat-containing protein 1 n=1 Tax=Poecilia reticulata TaxID=8081 RepID=UPI0004A22900|nr:PREDICTED: SEC14 domain and spectrin repeat-containing protein 1 [Poecilia reticulata]
MSGVTMEASSMLPILKKKLAFLSGGKDRRSGLILTIPLNSDQTSMEELSATLDYLLSIPSDKCKARGFTVIVDGRRSQWNIVKTVVLMLQNVIPAEVSLVCVVKPDEFWDKKVTHFCFWKEKDRLGFEVILVSANKLTRYIEPCQLTDDFGGSLDYDHSDWLNKRLVFEKFTKESTSLLDELTIINDSEKSASVDKDKSTDGALLPSFDPETVLQTGHELLSELQQRRFNGSEGGGGGGGQAAPAWCPMEEELLAQPQVTKLLDSLREQYTKYQELCRQRNKRAQLDEIHTKVMQVVNWLQGPGSELLKTQQTIGDSMRAAQALQQKHEEIESQHSEWFAVYVELNQQIAALLSAGEEEEVAELKGLQQQLSDVCYSQASQLETRQNVLQAAHAFHSTTQELSQQLDGLLGMLCADVSPSDGASIQQNLKLLEEKLQTVEAGLSSLRQKGTLVLEQMCGQASWALEEAESPPGEQQDNVQHVQAVMEEMELRKQRCIVPPLFQSQNFLLCLFLSILLKVLQQERVEVESLDEVDSSGRTLLDRLTLPIIFPDGSEQFFGSPSDTAATAEGVRERLLLIEERRLQLQEARLLNDEEGEEPEAVNGLEGRLDVIGEELSEKEEQDEEEKEAEHQDEDSERATQDR